MTKHGGASAWMKNTWTNWLWRKGSVTSQLTEFTGSMARGHIVFVCEAPCDRNGKENLGQHVAIATGGTSTSAR